jgi:hypothetical protein
VPAARIATDTVSPARSPAGPSESLAGRRRRSTCGVAALTPKGGRCGAKVWLTVPGKTDANGIYHVRRTIGRLPRGRYESWSRAITKGGVVETKFVTGRNRVAFTVKR